MGAKHAKKIDRPLVVICFSARTPDLLTPAATAVAIYNGLRGPEPNGAFLFCFPWQLVWFYIPSSSRSVFHFTHPPTGPLVICERPPHHQLNTAAAPSVSEFLPTPPNNGRCLTDFRRPAHIPTVQAHPLIIFFSTYILPHPGCCWLELASAINGSVDGARHLHFIRLRWDIICSQLAPQSHRTIAPTPAEVRPARNGYFPPIRRV